MYSSNLIKVIVPSDSTSEEPCCVDSLGVITSRHNLKTHTKLTCLNRDLLYIIFFIIVPDNGSRFKITFILILVLVFNYFIGGQNERRNNINLSFERYKVSFFYFLLSLSLSDTCNTGSLMVVKLEKSRFF